MVQHSENKVINDFLVKILTIAQIMSLFIENKNLKEENETLKAQVAFYKGFYDGKNHSSWSLTNFPNVIKDCILLGFASTVFKTWSITSFSFFLSTEDTKFLVISDIIFELNLSTLLSIFNNKLNILFSVSSEESPTFLISGFEEEKSRIEIISFSFDLNSSPASKLFSL